MFEPKICEGCGKLFDPPYRVTKAYWAKRRFCSDTCYRKAQTHFPRSPAFTSSRPWVERFWEKVAVASVDQCWLWTSSTDVWGYGLLLRAGRMARAHRISYELNVGPIPDGLYVLHHCDNPTCVNPQHLYAGTPADNARDREARGRRIAAHGSQSGKAKLTESVVGEMRRAYANGGTTHAALGKRFGVAEQTVQNVLAHKTWQHVP